MFSVLRRGRACSPFFVFLFRLGSALLVLLLLLVLWLLFALLCCARLFGPGVLVLFPLVHFLRHSFEDFLGFGQELGNLPRVFPHKDPQFFFYAGFVRPRDFHKLVGSSGSSSSFVMPLDVALVVLGVILCQRFPRHSVHIRVPLGSSPVMLGVFAYPCVQRTRFGKRARPFSVSKRTYSDEALAFSRSPPAVSSRLWAVVSDMPATPPPVGAAVMRLVAERSL